MFTTKNLEQIIQQKLLQWQYFLKFVVLNFGVLKIKPIGGFLPSVFDMLRMQYWVGSGSYICMLGFLPSTAGYFYPHNQEVK